MTYKNKFFGAVEIGTSNVTVLIAETNGQSLHIIGVGEATSAGVIKGSIIEYRAASDALHRALLEAQRKAGVQITEVFLAHTGGHIDGFYNEASVNVSAANNQVSAIDIDTVCQLVKSKALPEGRCVVHHLRRPFRLDGQIQHAPEHLTGRRLEAAYWTVHGQESKIADQIHLMSGFKLHVSELVLSGIASGTVLTTPEDRQVGALVIDIGAGTTDYALFRDGCAQVAGVVPVGGSHLTNDLSLGLHLSQGQAEKLKLGHGRGIVTAKDRTEKVWLNGDYAIGDDNFPRLTIEQITAARTWEIFEVVKKKLGTAFSPDTTAAGIYLTGGASKLAGIDDAAARVFGVPARVAELPGWVAENLRDPRYSTVLGLLHHGLVSRAEYPAPRRETVGGLFKKFFTAGV